MKNTTKTVAVVCTLFLIATLFVGAASARDVNNADTAFVYEKITYVDPQQVPQHVPGYLNYFDKDGVFLKSIPSNENGIFNLLDVSVDSYTGIWYYSTSKLSTKPTTDLKTVNIQYPKLSIDLRKGANSLNEKSIIHGETGLELVLDAPYVTRDMDATVSVFITTPAGGTKNLNSIPLEGERTIIPLNVPDEAQTGTYTIQAEFDSDGIAAQYKKSATISVTINSADLTITTAKDSIIRSNPFVVTVSGEALTDYYLTVETPGGINFLADQKNVKINSDQNATITTDVSGKITVEFTTTAETKDKTYIIKVCSIQNADNYDTAKVKVEKGEITITASDDDSYYIGNEIKLTGTNTDSSEVYLFITGPNFDKNIDNPADVKTDSTWEYKLNTSELGLDIGAYTIYATSTKVSSKPDSNYATISVNLKQPFLSAIPSGTAVVKGDKLYIRGNAEGSPNALKIFIFGPNFFKPYTISVEADGSYEGKIDTEGWSPNQYFVVVQHPMRNDVFDAKLVLAKSYEEVSTIDKDETYQFVIPNTDDDSLQGVQSSFIVWGANKLQSSNAADALTKMIDSSNIDDIYTKLTFTVTEPMIKINKLEDPAVGSSFTISGTTNLAVDDQILVKVMSSSFTATDKTSTDRTSGVSQTTKVVAGKEKIDNTWSVTVDTTNWKLDEYTITVTGIGVGGTATDNFNLVKNLSDTPTPTTTSTTSTTTAIATETPATPGFGALAALAGLGSVALLVLRRN